MSLIANGLAAEYAERFSVGELDMAAPRLSVLNPATGAALAHLATDDLASAVAGLDRASHAAEKWAATPARQRSDILMRAYQTMTERCEGLANLISAENGKSHTDALAEVRYAAEYFRWYAEEAVRLRGESFDSPTGANRVLVSSEPIGVCLLITPWNFPAAMATRKIGPALAAGCTAILKPAAETPLTAIAIADILQESGLPDGVLNLVITEDAAEIVSALMRDGRIRLLSFTGSTEVGRKLLKQASGTVMKTAMELGGNAPFLVFDDADIEAALDGAMIAKMRNTGQACTAANRFYVHDSIHDQFVDELAARMSMLRVGDPADVHTQVGPLINSQAVTKVQELVDDALSRGARAVIGGFIPEGVGSFYPPTVLTDVPADARILAEEVFGPVAPVVRFDLDATAVDLANDTEYGLVSYLYTGDLARGFRLSAALQAGMIALNRGLVSDPAAPFGGVKQSGLGREGSHEGLHEYLELKYLATSW